jgi:hypothetical protein
MANAIGDLVVRATNWKESDLRKHPTATLELIDALVDVLKAEHAIAEDHSDGKLVEKALREALEGLRKLSEKATAGPWVLSPLSGHIRRTLHGFNILNAEQTDTGPFDTAFAAECVNYVRAALAAHPAGRDPAPPNPSPTPWDSSTWGWYCDTCRKFFDSKELKAIPTSEGWIIYEHKTCGQPARYITYQRDAASSAPPSFPEKRIAGERE